MNNGSTLSKAATALVVAVVGFLGALGLQVPGIVQDPVVTGAIGAALAAAAIFVLGLFGKKPAA